MTDFIVEVQGLCVQFGSFFAVKDVSFCVPRGEIFGFLGANGAGKTTTIRVICGLLPATKGSVIVDGEPFLPGREDRIKAKVGYMSQRFTLYEDLTVGENLDFAAMLHQVSGALYKQRKEDLFAMIQFNRTERTMVADLPSGTKQQVALVASLIHDPNLVVLDEPTAGVSPVSRQKFWELIHQLAAKGKTIFVTTHYMDEAENCNRIVLMRSGEIIALGTPKDLEKETFPKPMFRLLPKSDLSTEQLKNFKEQCELFMPYGRYFHVIFPKEGLVPPLFQEHFSVESIAPSLEDVFIQKVEGDRSW
ncbi:multidrug ABC transporter ATP-binding protein [Alphaproteobacteria bacterium]|nr:multidrug ABC transporter ATP-binding protein [Alphaproteobacteria bacterium]GHS96066.1 multidrug ABC transporter ATP-binding protein [Alphaproteobacteria bacterium]